MNHVLVSLAASILLFGCSAPGDLKQRQPLFSIASAKDAKSVAGCISDRFAYTEGWKEVTSRLTANGYIVQKEDRVGGWGTSTSIMLEILDNSKGGSTTQGLFAWDILDSAIRKVRDHVEICAK